MPLREDSTVVYAWATGLLPQPIATACARARVHESGDAQLKRLTEALEVTLCTLVCLIAPDFLSGATEGSVAKQLWEQLTTPALGDRWKHLDKMAKVLARRETRFFDEFPDWMEEWGAKIRELINRRNSIQHGIGELTSEAQRTEARNFEDEVLPIIRGLKWLADYRVFRITREGSDPFKPNEFSAEVQIFLGSEPQPPILPAKWTKRLYPLPSIYVAHGRRGALNLRPFFQVPAEHNPTGQLFILWEVDRKDKNQPSLRAHEYLTLKLPQTGASVKRQIGDSGGPSSWEQFVDACTGNPELLRVDCKFRGALRTDAPEGSFLSDKYEVLSLCGEGAAGIVWKARDVLTGSIYAIKALKDPSGQDEGLKERFKREIRVAELIEHHNIVRSRWEYGHGRRPLIVMEYMDGGTLDDLINRSKDGLDELHVIRYGRQLMAALAYLADKNVVHRDLKPSNILRTSADELKVADFGVAKLLSTDERDKLTMTTETVGTQGYQALEQLDGLATFASDMYSVAVILAELRMGRRPQRNERPSDILPREPLAALIRMFDDPTHPADRESAHRMLTYFDESLRRSVPPEDRPSRALVQLYGRAASTLDRYAKARALGHALRQTINLAEPLTSGAPWEGLAEPAHDRAEQIWRQLRREHLGIAWPHIIPKLRVGDLRGLPKPQIDEATLLRLLTKGATPEEWGRRLAESLGVAWAIGDYHRLLGSLPAEVLTLREWVECVRSTKEPHEHTVYRRMALRLNEVLRKEGEDPVPLSPGWHELIRSISVPYYTRRSLTKRGGGRRWIHQPNRRLKALLSALARSLRLAVPGHPLATAFIPRRSPALHARYHAGAQAAVVVDIHDFFGSVRGPQVGYALRNTVGGSGRARAVLDGWSARGRAAVLHLCLVEEPTRVHSFLPQGAPTSPALANLVAYALDSAVELALTGTDWTYSRYADDLVLSSPTGGHAFHEDARAVLLKAIQSFDWRPAAHKVRHWSTARGAPLIICGVQVPQHPDAPLRLPPRQRKALRSAIHKVKQGQATHVHHGTLAYGYSVTANHAYKAALPGLTRDHILELGVLIFGAEDAATAFWAGWIDR